MDHEKVIRADLVLRRAQRRRDLTAFIALLGGALTAAAVFGLIGWLPALAVTAFVALTGAWYAFLAGEADQGAAVATVRAAAVAAVGQDGGSTEAVVRRLLEAMPDPVLALDATGRVEASNAAARARFRIPAAGAQLQSFLRQPELLDALASAAEGRVEDVAYTTTGPIAEHVRAHVAALSLNDRQLRLVVFHDETQARKVEQMRVDFLADASHELRTPLAVLAGYIETLRGHARDDAQAQDRFLTVMQGQAERMRRLINDLLSLSRIELNEHVPPTARADLGWIAREAVDAMAPIAQARGVRLEITGPTARVWVTGDRDQLTQVLQNLIDNAIKFARARVVVDVGDALARDAAILAASRRWSGAARISISPPPSAAAEAFAFVRVSDDGRGIPRAHLPRLSERFYRVEDQRSSERTGTGLGLAIVKHIVNRHRGALTVESVVDEGSAFAILVPGAGASPHEANGPAAAEAMAT